MFKKCNLCNGPIIKILRGPFGTRCLLCRSTFIHRAMGIVLDSFNFRTDIKVYELSSHGAFYKYLVKRFKNLTSSEYFDDVQSGKFYNGTLCQNVEALTFEDNFFDLITSTEVFEHVANDIKGFSEVNRVLKKGGYFVFTVPLTMKENTVDRAVYEDGAIKYLLNPTFGGDHLRTNGILDFRNYGLDIVDRLRHAGFKRTEIREVSDFLRSIPCKHVLIAQK
jgi:SAM-dependent methyltransferase